MRTSNKRGQVIVAAVFVLVVIALLGIVAVALLSSESITVIKNYQGIQAFNLAEAGVRFTVASSIAANSDLTTLHDFGPVTLNPGTFSIRFLSTAKNSCSFESTGTVQGVSRTVRTGFGKGNSLQSIAQEYVIYWGGTGGTGTVELGQNVHIVGDVFSNSTLNLNNATVSGDAISTGTITGYTGVTGTVEARAGTPEGAPSLNTTPYLTKIATAAANPTYTGNRTFNGTLAPGTYYVRGDVTLSDLTLTGVTTIVATGKVDIGNNKSIGDQLTVIASREITMGNNNDLGENGLWYSSVAITVGNQADVANLTVGAGTSFITPGNVTFANSAQNQGTDFNGYIYAGGTLTVGNNMDFHGLMVASNVSVQNNANIYISPDVVNFDMIPGIVVTSTSSGSGTGEFTDWFEVY